MLFGVGIQVEPHHIYFILVQCLIMFSIVSFLPVELIGDFANF